MGVVREALSSSNHSPRHCTYEPIYTLYILTNLVSIGLTKNKVDNIMYNIRRKLQFSSYILMYPRNKTGSSNSHASMKPSLMPEWEQLVIPRPNLKGCPEIDAWGWLQDESPSLWLDPRKFVMIGTV